MSDNNLNKKYFTEADCPIQLIPADVAWTKMEENLQEKRKRRFFFWLNPVGCTTALLFILAAGIAIWWLNNEDKKIQTTYQKRVPVQLQPPNNQPSPIHSPEIIKHESKLPSRYRPQATYRDTIPVNALQQATTVELTLTAINETAPRQEPGKFAQPPATTKRNRRAAAVATTSSQVTADASSFPVSMPQRVEVLNEIAITCNRPIPGIGIIASPAIDTANKNKLTLSTGLQWQLPIPVYGTDHYFTGANGINQPQQYLIPGIWLGLQKSKHRFAATFHPFHRALLPHKRFDSTHQRPTDSTFIMVNKSVNKVFGMQAGLYYNYYIKKNWWVGAGLNANWWNKALILVKPLSPIDGKPFVYSIQPKEDTIITRFQLSTGIETGIRLNRWEGLLQLSRPIRATVKELPAPAWINVIIRYRLGKCDFLEANK